ncbi:hypothetical protein [Bradyrhizobium sp.]|jgi:hypothetical protein|uniref:hypothetical protein n=1 Tax=Bradyrhizobium sp. TaxID=376 RepID=UPI002DDDA036|nr:hypothetical protein [Bradyrhizobium sp.]HEV2159454.1 hypothetical protein [Bradyrhizobium sp.]
MDELQQLLQKRLSKLEHAICSIKSRAIGSSDTTEVELLAYLAELELHIDAQLVRIEQIGHRVISSHESTSAAIADDVDEWKQRGDLKRLRRRSMDAAALATEAFEFAEFAVKKAEHAALEARLAKADADKAEAHASCVS